jgi:putative transposase
VDSVGSVRTVSAEREALVGALPEMYVRGVSIRKVKAITEELCGHECSASTISRLNQNLDGELQPFAGRKPEGDYPCLILDARGGTSVWA